MNPVVLDNTQGRLADLHDATVGVAVLALDPGDEIPGTVHYLSELTGPSGWEVEGDEYARQTTDLRYGIEDGAGVVRYKTTPPAFDLTGIGSANAVAYYDLDGADDAAHEVHFIVPVEDGPGFPGWTPDEPERGLARVGRVVPVLELVAGDGVTVDSSDPQRPVITAEGAAVPAIQTFEPVLLNGWGGPVDLNGGYTYGRYQMLTESLCWFEAWVDINAGGTPATGTGPFIFLLPKPVKQEPPVGGRPVLRTVGDVVAVRGTPTSNTGKCRGAVTGGDLSTAFGAPPGTVAPQACIFDNVTSDIDEEAQSFGWTTPPSGDGFPFDWCVDAAFLKFTGTYEIEPA